MRAPWYDIITRVRIGVRRLFRADASPYGIAMGVALGMYLSCLPLPGQTLLALLLATMLHVNRTAIVLATNFHVPGFLFVFHWTWQTMVGMWILGQPMSYSMARAIIENFRFTNPHSWKPMLSILEGWLVGAQVFGIPMAVISFWVTYRAARAFHERRRQTRLRLDRQSAPEQS